MIYQISPAIIKCMMLSWKTAFILSVAALRHASSHHLYTTSSNAIPTSPLPQCSDLADNTERFYVEEAGMKLCDWVDRKGKEYWRCKDDNVQENCPVTCEVPCQTLSLATSPSPSSSPYPPLSDIPFCEDDEDSTARFYVEGTRGNGMRTCKWATNFRCRIPAVSSACPVTCGPACRYKSDVPTAAPNTQEAGISELNDSSNERSENSLVVKIGCGITGGIMLLIILALLVLRIKQQKKPVSSLVSEQIIYDGDEEWVGISVASDSSNSLYPSAVTSLPKNSSFVPADEKNLAGKHSAKDVQCCDNFPCENCRMETNIKFVRANVNKRKARKAGYDISRNNNSSHNDVLCEVISEVPSVLLSHSEDSNDGLMSL
jgi:hypothetical protein